MRVSPRHAVSPRRGEGCIYDIYICQTDMIHVFWDKNVYMYVRTALLDQTRARSAPPPRRAGEQI